MGVSFRIHASDFSTKCLKCHNILPSQMGCELLVGKRNEMHPSHNAIVWEMLGMSKQESSYRSNNEVIDMRCSKLKSVT